MESLTLNERIELEAELVTIDQDDKLPKGYLDGMLFAFDLVLMWIPKYKSSNRRIKE